MNILDSLGSDSVFLGVIRTSNHNFIDTYVTYKKQIFYATFVYGAPEVPNRQAVWDQLSVLALTRDSPWFLTGDFNEIIDNSKKSGGPERPESSFGPFRSFLSASDLFDIQHTGNFLSWRGQRGKHLVHCRLDRSIANSHWSDLFPTARSHYLEFENSDHRPLLTSFDPTKKKPKRIFRYDRRLRYSKEVNKIIEEAWKKGSTLPVSKRGLQTVGELSPSGVEITTSIAESLLIFSRPPSTKNSRALLQMIL